MPWLPTDPTTARAIPPFAAPGAVACTPDDADAFYVDRGGQVGDAYARARAICTACPVKTKCLRWAIQTRQRYGMWGGTTPEERRALWRELQRRHDQDPQLTAA
jgi:WhiB family redox-sensing transcriptional regulator